MRDPLATSDGWRAIFKHMRGMNHAEFRMFVMLIECPNGDHFAYRLDRMMAEHRLTYADIIDAVDRLNRVVGFLWVDGISVCWRPFDA